MSDDESSSGDEEVISTINLEVQAGSQESLATVPSAESVGSNIAEFSQRVNIEIFNNAMPAISTSPIDLKKIDSSAYVQKKCDEIYRSIRKNIFGLETEVSGDDKIKEFDEMINQLKEKFDSPETTRYEQLQLLTVLPRSWTVLRIINTFGASKYMATQAKELLSEKGALSAQKPTRMSTGLQDTTKELVVQFFEDDETSRAMPGKNDCVTIRKEGKRQSVQKRLMMSTLRESYLHFRENNEKVEIGFSSFAKLRPKNCKLLTSSGTHNVCVCTIHENVNLMFHSMKKYNFPKDFLETLTNSLMCKDKTTDCYLRYCENCKSSAICEQLISDEIEEACIEEIHFEQWVTTDRCDIETFVKKPDEFVSFLISKLEKLIPHDFIKNEQSKFLKTCKSNLNYGEFLVICDFSENYSFVLQDEVQSHHWNNQQATIHPFVIYYKEDGELKHLSFVVISEDLRHDSITVSLFISKMIDFLRTEQSMSVNKIYFISDGAASQYKNRKNFASLCHFKQKYNIVVEWHFFATSHGKGPCDAIGGTLKRMATRASLAKEREHPIKNARELYDWAQMRYEEELTKICFGYAASEEYDNVASQFNEHYSKAKTIHGTQKYHAFIPISQSEIGVKLYSNCVQDMKIVNIFKK